MSNNFLKTCKKCVIKTVVNPGIFWMTEYEENSQITQNDLKLFEKFLLHELKEVKRRLGPQEIFIGQIVAVIEDDRCFRGLVTDIFDKNFKHTYEILLIDHGNVITTTASNICLIENKDLREKESVAFKVSLHGVVPVTLDINIDHISSNTVFQKRISKTWSAAALKFVKSYLKDIPFVYVKFIEIDHSAIKGDIYVIEEQGKKPIPLSKLLCDKDFAVICQGNSKLYSNTIEEKTCDLNDIEKKIPHTALSRKLQNLELYKSYISSIESFSDKSLGTQNHKFLEMSFSNLSLHSGSDDSDFQYSIISQQNGCPSTSSPEKDCLNTASNFSPAWILKKVKISSLQSEDSKSCDKSDKLDNIPVPKPKKHQVNFYELIKRNEERKKKENKDNYY